MASAAADARPVVSSSTVDATPLGVGRPVKSLQAVLDFLNAGGEPIAAAPPSWPTTGDAAACA